MSRSEKIDFIINIIDFYDNELVYDLEHERERYESFSDERLNDEIKSINKVK